MEISSDAVDAGTKVATASWSAAVLFVVATAASAAGDDALPPPPIDSGEGVVSQPPPPVTKTAPGKCKNCGVVRSIRQVERERLAPVIEGYIDSPQYLDTRNYSKPLIGPMLGFTFGPGTKGEAYVGAAGSPRVQNRLTQITYEVVLRFEDDRYGLYEQDDVSALRVGDRVKVVDARVVRAD